MKIEHMARGKLLNRIRSVLFLLPAWFAPAKQLRVFFHRLRGVNIGRNAEIGYFCIIGNVHPHMITIEDDVVIAAGAVLLEHDNSHYYTRGGRVKYGPVIVKKRAFIGIYAVIVPNVTIGECSIVAANSLVLRSVPPNTVVGGVPAQFIIRNI